MWWGSAGRKLGRVKAQLELDLAAAVKDNKNCPATRSSAKDIVDHRKTKNVQPDNCLLRGLLFLLFHRDDKIKFKGVGNTREPFKEEKDKSRG